MADLFMQSGDGGVEPGEGPLPQSNPDSVVVGEE